MRDRNEMKDAEREEQINGLKDKGGKRKKRMLPKKRRQNDEYVSYHKMIQVTWLEFGWE